MGLKKVLWAPQIKLIFLTSVILPNIEGGYQNGPGHLDTIRPQYAIQKVSTLVWPSVYCKKITYKVSKSIIKIKFIDEHALFISSGMFLSRHRIEINMSAFLLQNTKLKI